MRKKIIGKLILVCVISACVVTGVSAAAGHVKKFKGENGKIITVYGNSDIEEEVSDKEKPAPPKIGDIIEIEGHKERVTAVAEDGAYISEIVEK